MTYQIENIIICHCKPYTALQLALLQDSDRGKKNQTYFYCKNKVVYYQ